MIGQLLAGHYKIIKVLGAGGFGKTYIAEDIHLPGNPQCVLKHLNPASNDPYVLDTARRLFQREAEILQQLGTHEQIPRLLAYFEQDQEFYLVQELINGYTLGEELPVGQKWPEAKIIAMLSEVLKILEFVHTQGVIHRDIKPDNIMRRAEDHKLVLIDFGAIKQVRNQTVMAGSQASVSVAIGTPGYMPTEQSRGKPRPNSDIYALGMIAIQALTGVYPHQLEEDGETGEILWQHLIVSANPKLIAILQKMTRYHFKDRYQTADEVLAELNYITQPQNTAPQPIQPIAPTVPAQPIQPIAQTVPAQPVSPGYYSQEKITPVAPANPLSTPTAPTPASTPRSSKKPIIWVGLGLLVTVAGIALSQQNFLKNALSSNSTSQSTNSFQESCFAVISGNIRSAPTSSQNNVIGVSSGDKLEITGKKTPGGWIEVKFNDNLGWSHQSRISNQAEINACLQRNNLSFQTTDDNSTSAQTPQTTEQETQPTSETTTQTDYQKGLAAGKAKGEENGQADGSANGGKGSMHIQASCSANLTGSAEYIKGFTEACEGAYVIAFQSASEKAQQTESESNDESDSASNDESTDDTPIKCTAGQYTISITGDRNSGYTYTSYDTNSSESNPGLVLSGQREDRRTGYLYTFNNGNYSYQLFRQYPARGGEMSLSVYESGNPLRSEPCQ